ncbi:hypothetical protein E4T56_gene1727 [Termitomyces sp. T112]|nr:hypothetical protein E4T56_gene1727 [Termitomyces sp. T112]
MTSPSATHPPAIKVGGRRLSVSSRPKHAATTEPTTASPSPPTDYPRPVHTTTGTDEQAHAPPPPHHEDEPPKKEKRHQNHEHEKHLRDLAQRKSEATRPSKDLMGGNKGFGAAGRIAQPAGRSLAI